MQQHKNDLPNMEDFFNLSMYLYPKVQTVYVLKLKLICKGFAPFILMQIIDACVCTYIVNVCVLGICNKRMCCGMYTYNVMHTIYLCKL